MSCCKNFTRVLIALSIVTSLGNLASAGDAFGGSRVGVSPQAPTSQNRVMLDEDSLTRSSAPARSNQGQYSTRVSPSMVSVSPGVGISPSPSRPTLRYKLMIRGYFGFGPGMHISWVGRGGPAERAWLPDGRTVQLDPGDVIEIINGKRIYGPYDYAEAMNFSSRGMVTLGVRDVNSGRLIYVRTQARPVYFP